MEPDDDFASAFDEYAVMSEEDKQICFAPVVHCTATYLPKTGEFVDVQETTESPTVRRLRELPHERED
ncbi:hypothetical protein [Burkholderia anthina]|uniref:hypothetical protein n=1 Tax=Burkholderia anthina TaxID=179879 RepID=UPI0037C09F5D